MTSFRLLANNGFSVQDNPEPSQWVQPIIEAGFRGVEFFSDHLDPAYYSNVIRNRSRFIRETVKTIRRHGLEVIAIGTGRLPYLTNLLAHPSPDMAAEGLRWCRGLADLAHLLGARYITGHYDYITASDLARHPGEAMARVARGLLRFGEYAAKRGVKAIFLEQMYTPHLKPYTLREGAELLRRLNRKSAIPFMMHLDTGHAAPVGPGDLAHTSLDKNPYAWLSADFPGGDISFVHLQQTDSRASRHWPFTRDYNRRGIIRAGKIIQSMLERAPREAYLSFEILYPRQTPLARIAKDLRASREYFLRAFRRKGFDTTRDVILPRRTDERES